MVDIVKIGKFLYESRKWLLVLAVILALLSLLVLTGTSIRLGDNIISVNATMDKSNVNMSFAPGAERDSPELHPKFNMQFDDKGTVKWEYKQNER